MATEVGLIVNEPELLRQLRTDLRAAAASMGVEEARYLVDTYYMMQKQRIRADNQRCALGESSEPHQALDWLAEACAQLEGVVSCALRAYASAQPLGVWCMAQKGVGPILTAGLLAHIDCTRAHTAAGLWRFAGLDPTSAWQRGEKRPYNALLKTLCWKLGESFVKVSGKADAFYGQLYVERKAYEVARNEAGELAEQAAAILKARPSHAQAVTYKAGKLPDGHIHARAKRWTVKMFLAHYFEVAVRLRGETPPRPYPREHQGHTHVIEAPGPPVWLVS